MDAAGLDILLVGDSVAMVVHGHDTTLPVTLDEMLVHCRAASRGSQRCARMRLLHAPAVTGLEMTDSMACLAHSDVLSFESSVSVPASPTCIV